MRNWRGNWQTLWGGALILAIAMAGDARTVAAQPTTHPAEFDLTPQPPAPGPISVSPAFAGIHP